MTRIQTHPAVLADERRYAAMVAQDVAALEQLLADSMLYVHSNGTVDDKGGYLAKIAGSTFRYERIEHPVSAVEDLGTGGAAVFGRMIAHGQAAGRPVVVDSITTAVWRQRDGRWELVAFQSTRSAS